MFGALESGPEVAPIIARQGVAGRNGRFARDLRWGFFRPASAAQAFRPALRVSPGWAGQGCSGQICCGQGRARSRSPQRRNATCWAISFRIRIGRMQPSPCPARYRSLRQTPCFCARSPSNELVRSAEHIARLPEGGSGAGVGTGPWSPARWAIPSFPAASLRWAVPCLRRGSAASASSDSSGGKRSRRWRPPRAPGSTIPCSSPWRPARRPHRSICSSLRRCSNRSCRSFCRDCRRLGTRRSPLRSGLPRCNRRGPPRARSRTPGIAAAADRGQILDGLDLLRSEVFFGLDFRRGLDRRILRLQIGGIGNPLQRRH